MAVKKKASKKDPIQAPDKRPKGGAAKAAGAGEPEMSGKKSDLRRRAEEELLNQPGALDGISSADVQSVVHELKVHQIELEMQNQELCRTQQELEASREKYFDLYNLAPVGYITLNDKGIILEANLTAAALLGHERSSLINQPLTRFIGREDQDIYYHCNKKLFQTLEHQECEVRMLKSDGTQFWVRLETVAANGGNDETVYRMAIIDITRRRQTEEQYRQHMEELVKERTSKLASVSGEYEILSHTRDELEKSVTQQAAEITQGKEALQTETAVRKKVDAELMKGEELYRSLFDNMLNGCAYCEMIFDKDQPYDFVFLSVNNAFTPLTGLKDVVGKKITEIIPGIRQSDPELFELYARVALSGKPEQFEIYVKALKMWLSMSFYSPHKEHFVALFDVITDRKQAEEALKMSEERLKLALEAGSMATWDWQVSSGEVIWNDMHYSMLGYQPGEVKPSYQAWKNRIYHEDIASIKELMRRCMEEGCDYSTEYRVQWPDGTVRWIEAHGRFELDPSGQAVRSYGTMMDITERKKAADALQESEKQVRHKLESVLSPEGNIGDLDLADIIDSTAIQILMDDFYKLTHMPMSIIDIKGKVLVGVGWQEICLKFHRAHKETCRHCMESDLELTADIPPGEFKLYKCKNNMWDMAMPIMVAGKLMGRLFMGQFFFDDEPVAYDLFRTQAKQYGFDEKEYLAALDRVPRLNRMVIDTARGFFMKFADMISRLSYSNIKLARLLTERDMLMVSLRESEERLERAQKIAHLGSWELDLVDNKLSWSDEVYRIFGLEPQEFGATYKAFLDRVHPDDRTAVDAAYSGSLREGRDNYEIEHRVVRKSDNAVRIVHEKCEHFRDETGTIVRSIGMVHDITERKKAEEEIKRLNEDLLARNEQLEYANKELESFIYSVSHDLRAPLRHISGFTNLVMKNIADKLDDNGKRYLSHIYKGTEKMSRLIDDLLNLSRFSRQEIRRRELNLSEIAASIITELREADPSRNVEVDIKEGLIAFADRGLVELLLQNLLQNAWKFTVKTEHARIELGTIEQDGKIIYYVRDNGAGFDQQYAGKMFWPFHRLHPESAFDGTGIGLAIVERIIRSHGGKVWAEGTEGKGATIYFSLI